MMAESSAAAASSKRKRAVSGRISGGAAEANGAPGGEAASTPAAATPSTGSSLRKTRSASALNEASALENGSLSLEVPEAEEGAVQDGEDDEDDDDDFIPTIDTNADDEEDAFPEEGEQGQEADLEDSSEAGFDSEDIDNWDDEEEDLREQALRDEEQETDDSELEETLSQMIQEARGPNGKPDEKGLEYNKFGIDVNKAAPGVDLRVKNPDGSNRGIWKTSEITGQPKRVYPAIEPNYDSDSSTEDAPNRIGNVPLEWYDDLPHIGYDIDGKKVMRPAKGDELDRFLATVDDPESWMTAQDKTTGADVKLTDEELDIIRRLQNAEIPDGSYDPYEPTIEWFTGKGMEMETPLTARPEPKRRFVPSKWEHKKVMKIVRAIRAGRIVPRAPAAERPPFYNIWSEADEPRPDHPMNMPAPKMPLPGHAESYNPPAEYLFDEEEKKEFEEAEKEDRKMNFMPAKYNSFRLVPGYRNFMQERFERCLDLYLAPRIRRKRIDIQDPESLVPKLPSPKELRPFPSITGVVYSHPGGGSLRVRCVAVDPLGAWCATGAEDGRVRLWDLAIGRCTAVWDLHATSPARDRGPVQSLEWCPNKGLSILVATTAGKVVVIAPPQASVGTAATASPSFLFATAAYQALTTASAAESSKNPVKWTRPREVDRNRGVAVNITVPGTPKQIAWHAKGDYFATVASDAGSSGVVVHQLSKHRSQTPFKRAHKGSSVQKVVFHPFKPHLFVATQRYVRIYDLAAQELIKTLLTGLKWISSLDVHPGGDNLIVGSYDKRLLWFDLELSNKPYKTLHYHAKAIRAVAFHRKYPLFASVSDDGSAQIFHGTVFSDFSQNALIVPLKVLRGHQISGGLGVLDAAWHPTQPWLFTAGADGKARLWTT